MTLETIIRSLALVAMVPAAANPSIVSGMERVTVSLCQGGSITLPGGQQLPGSDGKACCNKGCHGGDKRKRAGNETQRDRLDN